jgi:hypothetical protein
MLSYFQTQQKATPKPSFAPIRSGLLQRCTATTECDDCRKKRLGLQRSPISHTEPSSVPPIVHEVLRSPGQPLDSGIRAFMEPRFGHDFSSVRIHTDAQAANSARAVNALAYTVGRDVVFGEGQFQPQSNTGQRLMAHELTHVVQQNGLPPQSRLLIERADSANERAAHAIAGGGSTRIFGQHGPSSLMRKPNPAVEPNSPDKAAADKAKDLENEILKDPAYKKLKPDSKALVRKILDMSRTKPLGDAIGQRNYYLTKLKIALTTPFEGEESGNAEYDCSSTMEKQNREEVEKALDIEKLWGGAYSDVDEKAVATGTHKVPRIGQGGKKFFVDRSDPRNIRVQMKVKLNGKPAEVASIEKLEDAIERAVSMGTKGYYLDIVFVDKSGPDVFEFTVSFCQWANSGNWASGPVTLSHEVHHALKLPDRYDYIESHADNRQMNVAMRLVWFAEQMKKTAGPRDEFSKMADSSNPLLAEDVCAVAFPAGPDRKKCIDARKDLDPAGIPAP